MTLSTRQILDNVECKNNMYNIIEHMTTFYGLLRVILLQIFGHGFLRLGEHSGIAVLSTQCRDFESLIKNTVLLPEALFQNFE